MSVIARDVGYYVGVSTVQDLAGLFIKKSCLCPILLIVVVVHVCIHRYIRMNS